MSPFIGGSAPSMARQVADGYTLLSEPMLKKLLANELDALIFEMEKALRDHRGEFVAADDQQALQKRNRKISRLEGGLRVVRGVKMKRRRRGI